MLALRKNSWDKLLGDFIFSPFVWREESMAIIAKK